MRPVYLPTQITMPKTPHSKRCQPELGLRHNVPTAAVIDLQDIVSGPEASRSRVLNPFIGDGKSVLTEIAPNAGLLTEVSADCAALYGRYVGLLALLCECAPYVDEPDYVDLIEAALIDASSNYHVDFRRNDGSFEIALRHSTSPKPSSC
ncbi:MAG: hypothetical protein ACKVP7_11735 [Hyphomicrobiaceae bacterium]